MSITFPLLSDVTILTFPPNLGGFASVACHSKVLKKRCRILPAGGLGVSPGFKIPQDWGIQGVDWHYFSNHHTEAARDRLPNELRDVFDACHSGC